MNKIPKDWYKTSFGKSYPEQYKWQEKLTDRQVAFVKKHTKKGYLLDAACGYGRHAIPLAEAGYIVTALDYSESQLTELEHRLITWPNPKPIPNIFLGLGDIRDFRLPSYSGVVLTGFDSVINMFSSFGYFSSRENYKLLKNFSSLLVKGGVLVLDLTNPFNLPPGGRVRRGRYEDDRGTNPFSFQLYTKQEISKLARKAGFYKLKFFGDYESHPYKKSSPRLILVAKKK